MFQLPLFKDKNELPTGKINISFSELAIWLECSFRHKLMYIDGHKSKENHHMAFGTILHKYTEPLFLDGHKHFFKLEKEEIIYDAHEELYKKFGEIGFSDDIESWETSLDNLIREMPAWLNKTFINWKPIGSEIELFEKIEGQSKSRWFKGFVDRVLICEKPPRKGSKPKPNQSKEFIYWILDLKTSGNGWGSYQRRDPIKKIQLILYKHYLCQKLNLDLKQVKCGFLICKRTPGKNQELFELIEVSVGEKVIKNTLEKVNNMVNMLSKSLYRKDRNSCTFCPFKDDKKLCP